MFASGALPQLKILSLTENQISDKGMNSFSAVLSSGGARWRGLSLLFLLATRQVKQLRRQQRMLFRTARIFCIEGMESFFQHRADLKIQDELVDCAR
eukprot:6342882-Prymnesium_polylepis.1